jgi:hypothetical protein
MGDIFWDLRRLREKVLRETLGYYKIKDKVKTTYVVLSGFSGQGGGLRRLGLG